MAIHAEARQHRADDHPRRRRGRAAVRPHRDDDQRAGRAHRRGAGRAAGAAAQAARARRRRRPTSSAASACSSSSTNGIASSRRHSKGSRVRAMTPEQVTLVQQTFGQVAPIADKAAEIFYDRLFEVAPTVQAAVSGRHGRAAPQADRDARGRGPRPFRSAPASSRRQARSPSVTSTTAPGRSTTPLSARRCCGRWSADWDRSGRRRRPPPGPRPTRLCPAS